MTCLDCLYCKYTDRWTKLFCAKGLWKYWHENEEITIRLTEQEIRSLHIRHRKRFDLAEDCPIPVEDRFEKSDLVEKL